LFRCWWSCCSINPKPSATITGDSSFCSTGGAAALTAGNPGTTTPYTYSWFLNGNSTGGNTNSITVSQEGNYTLQISDGNGCVSDLSPTFAVSRTPDDVATVTYPSTICKVPVGTGGASGSFALDGYFPLYLDYNDAAANSSDGGYHTHVINGLDYYMPNSGIVIYHGNYSLTTTPVITGQGGTFNNPTGLSINTQTGVIDKNASTAGTYTVEYTTNGSCPITVSNTVTINNLDNASMSYSASEYCQDVTDPVPTKSSTGTFSSSSGLVFTNSTTGEIDLDASTPGTYKIGFVTSGTCPNSGPLQNVTVTAREIATFNYSAGSYCQNAASNPTPNITGTTGGTFSSTTGLSINSTTGEIDLAASTVGSYVVTYTTAGTCSASSIQNVTVAAADVVSLSYPASSYPQTGTDPSPTFSPSGGTFSATPAGLSIDSNTGVIDLSASSVNSYTISYTSNGACPNTTTFNLSITSVSAAFNYSASEYCENAATDPTPTVTGTSGGTFSAALKFRPFQMQFDTSGGKTITIPNTVGSSFTVDWGDGNTTTETGGTISHTYASGIPTSTVSIGAAGDSGPFTTFKFVDAGSADDLLDVPQWGSIVFTTLVNMFQGCQNTSFQISATDAPTIIGTGTGRSMAYMFYNADYFNSNINHWDISNITGSGSTVRDMFNSADNFNQNLSSWNIQATQAYGMLASCGMSTENFTDTIVGWAVTVYKNSGLYNVGLAANYGRTFDCSRTSDNASGQTYAVKYGSDWTATGWTDAGDALDYLTGATANWIISNYTPQNC